MSPFFPPNNDSVIPSDLLTVVRSQAHSAQTAQVRIPKQKNCNTLALATTSWVETRAVCILPKEVIQSFLNFQINLLVLKLSSERWAVWIQANLTIPQLYESSDPNWRALWHHLLLCQSSSTNRSNAAYGLAMTRHLMRHMVLRMTRHLQSGEQTGWK